MQNGNCVYSAYNIDIIAITMLEWYISRSVVIIRVQHLLSMRALKKYRCGGIALTNIYL